MKMKENWKKQFQNSFETVPKLCQSRFSFI